MPLTYFTGIIAGTASGHYPYLNGRRHDANSGTPMTPWCNREWRLPVTELASIVRRDQYSEGGAAQPEGVLYVEQAGAWTLVACWDRSALDNRGGSSATWAVQTADLDAALTAIREHYGPTVARIEAHVGTPIGTWPRADLLTAYPQAPLTAKRRACCPTCGGSGLA